MDGHRRILKRNLRGDFTGDHRIQRGGRLVPHGKLHGRAYLLAGCAVVALFFRDAPNRKALAAYFFLVTASHGVLDALTNGGLGVAFFAPFSGARYFFPFRPVEVSPIGLSSFFSEWGLAVIESELLWVWLPASLLVAFVLIFRRLRGAAR